MDSMIVRSNLAKEDKNHRDDTICFVNTTFMNVSRRRTTKGKIFYEGIFAREKQNKNNSRIKVNCVLLIHTIIFFLLNTLLSAEDKE